MKISQIYQLQENCCGSVFYGMLLTLWCGINPTLDYGLAETATIAPFIKEVNPN